ncbi:MAG: T9SS type A sorting domain-containing protein [Chitinophagales bacterium]|nr:T9SS type A sorting domain-containing protein [Chitinophagales bacterium]
MSNHTKILFFFQFVINNILLASTIEVINLNDSGLGSLRYSINIAINGDSIVFNPNLITNGSDTLVLNSSIYFSKSITIKGLFNSKDTLFISGNNSNSIFKIDFPDYSNHLTFENLYLINAYSEREGGAISIKKCKKVNIANCFFQNNTALSGGGGISVMNTSLISSNPICSLTINQSKFISNIGNGRGGGAIQTFTNSLYIDINESKFIYNSTNSGGGAINIFSYNNYINITGSNFLNNIAESGGGAVLASSKPGSNVTYNISEVFIKNSTFAYNYTDGAGGGIYITASSYSVGYNNLVISNLKFINSTIAKNHSRYKGGGMYLSTNSFGETQSNHQIINSTIVNNSSTEGTGGIFAFNSNESQSILEITSSIVALNKNLDINKVDNSINTSIISKGYNIFSDSIILGTINIGKGKDYLGVDSNNLKLSQLGCYGGNTLTIIPLNNSIAINKGNPYDISIPQNLQAINDIRDVGSTESICYQYNNIQTNTKICFGDSIFLNNDFQKTSGIYIDTFKTKFGCDSIIKTNLLVLESNNDTCSTNIDKIKIYPNPANNYLSVESPLPIYVSLYSLGGKEIISFYSANKTTTIPTSELSSGLYILKVNNSRNLISEKVIIRH